MQMAKGKRGQFEGIYTSSKAGWLIFDQEGRVARMNPSAEALLTVKAADAVGRTCAELVPNQKRS
jgi:PAS domain S-box-containing protein